jgi:hypothetical protein
MNSPATDLPAASTGNVRHAHISVVVTAGHEADVQDDLVRQLAERARTQRLKHQLQRIRRQPV